MQYFARISVLFVFIVFVSNASGQNTWSSRKVESNGDLVAIYFTSAENGWIAGDKGYLARTSDGGKTWRRFLLDTKEDINEIYFRNEKTGYLVAGRKMFITNDSGEAWQEATIFRPGYFRVGTPEFLSIRFADKKYGYIVGSLLNHDGEVIDSLLMRTDDEGLTWRRQLVPTKSELFHLDFSGNSHGWIVGDQGVILATTDRGQTWRQQRSGTTRALFAVDFRDDKEGHIVGGGGTILRTTDGGQQWYPVNSGGTNALKRVDFPDDKNGWIIGFNGTILRSQDRGQSWQKVNSSGSGRIFGLHVERRFGFAVGENGMLYEFRS